MVEAHTFSLAHVQGGSDETEPSDGELCSRCHEDVERSEIVCQRTVLDNRRGWLIAAAINFSSKTVSRFADLEGLPSNNTMGPVNARPSLQDVKLNHDEGNREKDPEDS